MILNELYKNRSQLSTNDGAYAITEKLISELLSLDSGIKNSNINESINNLLNGWNIDSYLSLENNLTNINSAIESINKNILDYEKFQNPIVTANIEQIKAS